MAGEDGAVLRALDAPLPTTPPAPFDRMSRDGRWGIAVVLHPGGDAAAVLEAMVAAGASPAEVALRADGARLFLVAPPGRGAELAARASALPGVATVVPWGVPVPLNDDSIWVGQSYDTVGHTT